MSALGVRRTVAGLGLAGILAASCTAADPPGTAVGPTGGSPSVSGTGACSLPRSHLVRTRRGYHPERSGEIQIVPRLPNVVAEWLSHAGPWDHVQRVPLFFYGPGHVRAAGRVDRPATVADVPATVARLLDFDFDAPDGKVLREALPDGETSPPRLILTLIWDSAGRNVLAEHPDAWPTLRSLIPRGTWFDNATVGTSPSTTPAVHGTLGTGAFPRRHGLVDLRFRFRGGLAWIGDEQPAFLPLPTLVDLYSAETGQTAEIGLVASLATLSLLGHGAASPGGDRHLVAMHEDGRWLIGEQYADDFRFPSYVNEVGGLDEAVRRMDLEDGALDQRWMGERVLDDPEALTFSPAWAEHQTRVLEEIIRREGFGADEVPDLLFTNFKQIDTVGHRWTMNSPQMEAVVRSSDDALEALIEILDREVGEGEWVIALTADHGAIPDPELTGAFIIDLQELRDDLRQEFGGAVEQVRPTQLWVDEGLLEERGATLDDVVAFLADYRRADNVSDAGAAPEEPDARIFAAAFRSDGLRDPCA